MDNMLVLDRAEHMAKFHDVAKTLEVLERSFERLNKRLKTLEESYGIANDSFMKYSMNVRSNNWLKTHGYPMRRKKGSKKS